MPEARLEPARLADYDLIRWAYRPTDSRAWPIVSSPAWWVALEAAAARRNIEPAEATAALDALWEALQQFDGADAWQGAYHDAHGKSVTCSPHETDYTARHAFMQARELADIAGFYRAFGCEANPGAGERADHIGLECEFMWLLGQRLAACQENGDDEGATRINEAAVKFLEDHLGRFTTAFSEAAKIANMHPFFKRLAAVAAQLVAADVAALGLKPAAIPDTPLGRLPDQPECDGCGAEATIPAP